MKVQTDFEVRHFVEYLGLEVGLPATLAIVDKKDKFYIIKTDVDNFEVHEDALPLIQAKCPRLTMINRMLQ